MAYDSEDRLGIPEFMQKTNTYTGRSSISTYQRRQNATRGADRYGYHETYEEVRKRSLEQKTIHVKKSRKKVDKSLTGRLKRHWKGIAVTMGLGAVIFSGIQSFGNDLHELEMLGQNPVAVATHQAINDHKFRTQDNENWQLDTWGIEQDIDQILEDGGDPLTVLGTLANSLDETYTQDELTSIVEHSFGENPDTLVRSLNPDRYEEGIQDPDFKEDARNYIIQQEEARQAGIGLADMLNEKMNTENTSEKGMGGK